MDVFEVVAKGTFWDYLKSFLRRDASGGHQAAFSLSVVVIGALDVEAAVPGASDVSRFLLREITIRPSFTASK